MIPRQKARGFGCGLFVGEGSCQGLWMPESKRECAAGTSRGAAGGKPGKQGVMGRGAVRAGKSAELFTRHFQSGPFLWCLNQFGVA